MIFLTKQKGRKRTKSKSKRLSVKPPWSPKFTFERCLRNLNLPPKSTWFLLSPNLCCRCRICPWRAAWLPGCRRSRTGTRPAPSSSAAPSGTTSRNTCKYRVNKWDPKHKHLISTTGWGISSRTWVGLTWIWRVLRLMGRCCTTVSTYCPSRVVEHSKSKSTQPRSERRCPTLYLKWQKVNVSIAPALTWNVLRGEDTNCLR